MTKPGPLCFKCPLNSAPGPIWGDGPSNATLVNIGMAPAKEELQHGTSFIGKSGQVLNRNLLGGGVDRARTYTTNVVKCFVEPGKPIPSGAIECCHPLLERELEALGHWNTILTLGAEPFWAFTRKKLVLQSPMRKDRRKPPDPNVWLRGCVYPYSHGRVIIPTMHPAYLLRTGFMQLPFFFRDICKAIRFSKGQGTFYAETFNYNPTAREVAEYIERITQAGHFGLDIETPEKLDDEEENSPDAASQISVIGLSAGIGDCLGIPPDLYPLLEPLFSGDPKRQLRVYAFNWGFDGYHIGRVWRLSGLQPYDVMKAFILTYSDSMRKDLGTALSWWTDMPYTKNLSFTDPDRYNACDTYGALWAGIESEKELRSI